MVGYVLFDFPKVVKFATTQIFKLVQIINCLFSQPQGLIILSFSPLVHYNDETGISSSLLGNFDHLTLLAKVNEFLLFSYFRFEATHLVFFNFLTIFMGSFPSTAFKFVKNLSL